MLLTAYIVCVVLLVVAAGMVLYGIGKLIYIWIMW